MDSETGVRFTTEEVSLARVHNFWHHGKDHYQADRDFADQVGGYPGLASAAYGARRFQFDVTEHLITECKVTQFLDLGVGLPADPIYTTSPPRSIVRRRLSTRTMTRWWRLMLALS